MRLLGLRVRVRVRGIVSYDFTLHFLQWGWPDSHIQSLSTKRLGGYSSGAAFLPNPPISSPCTIRLRYRFLVETEMVLIPDAH